MEENYQFKPHTDSVPGEVSGSDSIIGNETLCKQYVNALWKAAYSSPSVRPFGNNYPSCSRSASSYRPSMTPFTRPTLNQGQQQQHTIAPFHDPAPIARKSEPKPKKEIKEPAERWFISKVRFSWDGSPIASYSQINKQFRCVSCNAINAYVNNIAEHYLENHANIPDSMWKEHPFLDEIQNLLNQLKTTVEDNTYAKRKLPDGVEYCNKRYMCPKCRYGTDRKDLYERHENIHMNHRPFQCYLCQKMYRRSDHVKRHLQKVHKVKHVNVDLVQISPVKNESSGSGGSYVNESVNDSESQCFKPDSSTAFSLPSTTIPDGE